MSDITNKKLVIDLDDTISKTYNGKYTESKPIPVVIDKIREYKSLGYDIIIYSSRNMRTYNRNVGEINIHTLPVILDFLKKYDIPHDEVIVGKPWCGFDGFYIDDKAIRPSEFVNLSENEIQELLNKEKTFIKEHVDTSEII
jgi:capsule biosynthesis phosphatase